MQITSDRITAKISCYAHDLGLVYIDSYKHEETLRNPILSCKIVLILRKYEDCILLMSKAHKSDLEDCLLTHVNINLTLLSGKNFPKQEIEEFRIAADELITAVKNDTNELDIDESERNKLSLLIYKITLNAQAAIAGAANDQSAKDALLANAIVYSFNLPDTDNRAALLNNLSLLREIWVIEDQNEVSEFGIKYIFYKNMKNYISAHVRDTETALADILDFFTVQNNIFEQLSDIQLIHLYDRLKNIDSPGTQVLSIISLLHTEAHHRYSYNRLNDTGYEMLSRFQNLDALAHQIEEFELAVIESYLLHSPDILSVILQKLINKAEYLKELALNKDENLIRIIERISTRIPVLLKQEQQHPKKLIDALGNKLSNPSDPVVQKKFNDLDKYTINFLKKRYSSLLQNINNLLDDNIQNENLLRESFAVKLASGYHLSNLSNSIDKIRKMSQDRKEAKNIISELGLIEIFTSSNSGNKITSLDFKNLSMLPDIKSPADYVYSVARNILANCNILQLYHLYEHLKDKINPTNHQLYLQKQITEEAKRRTTVGKKLLAVFSSSLKAECKFLERMIK